MTAIAAERIKLMTIRSPYWCLGLAVLFSIGVTSLFALLFSSISDVEGASVPSEGDIDGVALSVLLVGLTQFAVTVLMIMAVLGITSEYRFSTIRATFLATPNRTIVLVAKALVYIALTFVAMLILTLVCLAILKAGIGGFSFGDAAVIRHIWGVPLFASLCVLLSIGVGALVRQSAGAISIVLVWMWVLETILSAVPKVRDWAGPLLPFLNGTRFLSGGSPGDGFHWGPYVSLIYFAAWAVVIFVAGVIVTNRRDA